MTRDPYNGRRPGMDPLSVGVAAIVAVATLIVIGVIVLALI